MVAIVDKINGHHRHNGGRRSVSNVANTIKQEDTHQTARIIQWLGGERAVDVPAEFDVQSPLKEDCVDHQIIASKVECIELLRLKPMNKQLTTTFERGSLLRQSSRRGSCSYRSQSSPDAQTTDEAYCTLSTHRSGIEKKTKTNDLIRKGSTSGSSSLSTTVPNCTSSPLLTISIDDIYTTLDRAQLVFKMEDEHVIEDIGRLREIAQKGSFQHSLQLLPKVTHSCDYSMELFREIMFNDDNRDRSFKELVEEIVYAMERKLIDTEFKMFDASTIRASSPSLFDMLNDLKTCLTILRRTEMQSLLNVFDSTLKLRLYPSALPESQDLQINHNNNNNDDDENTSSKLNNCETTEELLKLSQYSIDELKIVKIEKTHEPLGLTITRTDTGTIHIARIIVGGIAANTQLFQINDRILEINDEPITGRSLDYVCSLMSHTTGLIKFLLAPPILSPSSTIISNNNNNKLQQIFYVRALYSYDPYNDPLLPCKELGLSFQRGDILRIVARDENFIKINDSYVSWWQAFRENSMETDTDPCLAGLIPSDCLQQKRIALLKALNDDTESVSSFSSTSLCSHKYHKKKKAKNCVNCIPKKHKSHLNSIYYNETFVRDIDEPDIAPIRTSTNHFSLTDTRQIASERPTTSHSSLDNNNNNNSSLLTNTFRFYDPVFRLDLSKLKMTRPIVLLGAPNVGRHELRRRLLQTEPNLFDVAIPHTTRARRLHEIPDIDYHYVSESEFLAKVACHSFVEFGQYDRDLYGTSVEDIRHVVSVKRKICILNLNPDAIRTFDKTDLFPYIICIAAPSCERLKRLELDRHDYLTDNDYKEIIRQSRSLERHHSLLFDYVIINNDLDRTYTELRDIIVRIQHDDQQWVRTCYRRS